MTTHSFADEVLDGPYEARVREYEEQQESLLATCRDTVRDQGTSCIYVSPTELSVGFTYLASDALRMNLHRLKGKELLNPLARLPPYC